MDGEDILGRVRKALHLADSLHTGDPLLAEHLLRAVERCREANRDFLEVLKQLRPTTLAGEQARTQLQKQLTDMDCGDGLLRSMLEAGKASASEIHTASPPRQIN